MTADLDRKVDDGRRQLFVQNRGDVVKRRAVESVGAEPATRTICGRREAQGREGRRVAVCYIQRRRHGAGNVSQRKESRIWTWRGTGFGTGAGQARGKDAIGLSVAAYAELELDL